MVQGLREAEEVLSPWLSEDARKVIPSRPRYLGAVGQHSF